jgi:hypothetical protein
MQRNVLKNSIGIYIFSICSLYALRPSFLFQDNGQRRRPFGLGYNRDKEKKTLFDMTTMSVVIAIVVAVSL